MNSNFALWHFAIVPAAAAIGDTPLRRSSTCEPIAGRSYARSMNESHTAAYEQLVSHARQTAILSTVESALDWDERTYLPPAAGPYRAEQITLLAGMIHARRTDPQVGQWLDALIDSPLAADRHCDTGTTIREFKRRYDKLVKLPQALVEELARTATLGQQAWVIARADNDFASFRPLLEKTVRLKREQADALGYPECRYDALLDDYEPGALTSQIVAVLSALRQRLAPLVAAIAESGRQQKIDLLTRQYPIDAQRRFGEAAAARIGFDFRRGRLDVTAHPFCTQLGPHDCRLTTRYDERHFPGAFFGILHEAGHGLYDQGLRAELFGLPPGDSISLGIHESQSRMWENLVGRSRAFWDYFFPQAQQAFPEALGGASLGDFYFAINDVRPSLIRVEADEATYNLHIIIRFELEQALLNDDLPRGRSAGGVERKISPIARYHAADRPRGSVARCSLECGADRLFSDVFARQPVCGAIFRTCRSGFGRTGATVCAGRIRAAVGLAAHKHSPGRPLLHRRRSWSNA